ncbi:arabinose-proton symporter-like [Thrips palmi]|uniref:Arabinose-proton symporter-like n=1 Tax=Thrips palmi TaxID=161013 RepID=A0A6P8ZAY4_THRPL|nr:arabinose-proton symporter-like [Thrips palmi]
MAHQDTQKNAQPKTVVLDVPDAKAQAPVGLEEALEITGYGRFNNKLLVGLWLAMAVQNFVGSDIAYSLPAAECDLNLTTLEKGQINAAMYVGMMLTAFVWGALSDMLGRKSLLLTAYFALAATATFQAFVSSSLIFIICRVVLGALLIGPASIALTFAGELLGPQYRSKVFMWSGVMQAISGTAHAGLAMWVIPLQFDLLRSWRAFMLVTALTSLCAGLFILLLPESPKYLAARGRPDDALRVLAGIFAENTRLPAATYPVKTLQLKNLRNSDEPANPFLAIVHQFGKLCRKPFLVPLGFVLAMQPLILFCQNTIRMWVPQMFAQMDRDAALGVTGREVCSVLEDDRPSVGGNATLTLADCDSYSVDASVYLNSIIIMSCRAGFQLAASFIIRPVGAKAVLITTLSVAGSMLVAWPWANTPALVLAVACIFEGCANTAFTTVLNIIVELFPTGVRSSAFSLSNFSGRSGSMVGNVVIPMLFVSNCSLAFWIGAVTFYVCALTAMFKPKPAFTPTPSTGLADRIHTANEARRRHTK